MKKKKVELKDSITIYNFDGMEHENIANVKLDIAPPKKARVELIFLILAIIFKVIQYISLIFDNSARLYIFGGLLFISWGLLIISRVIKSKWDVSKLVAIFFIVLLVLDIALIFLFIK